jgi:hypothetical protein
VNKIILILAFVLSINAHVDAQLKDLMKKAKTAAGIATGDENEMSSAMKEALQLGIDAAVVQLSADKGYLESPYKILIPEDAQKVIDKVKLVPGFSGCRIKTHPPNEQSCRNCCKKSNSCLC